MLSLVACNARHGATARKSGKILSSLCACQKRTRQGTIHGPNRWMRSDGGSSRQIYSLFEPPKERSSKSKKPDRSGQQSKNAESGMQKSRSSIESSSSLAELVRKAEDLNGRMSQLNALRINPKAHDLSTSNDEYQRRKELFLDAKALVENVLNGVQGNSIQPSRKHGPALSQLFGTILKCYSAALLPQDENHQSPFEACLDVLSLMDQWNLSRHGQHYHYAVLTAIHEQRWQEASKLFLQQIDPDLSTPIDISVSSPVGLYAIARASQQQVEGSLVAVEQVLDAVVNLSLMSPSEQEKYVLAAGTALGLAGEWKALGEYLESSYNASRLGQPLVAATMHACILCNQHDEALRVFETLSDGDLAISSEFHWGGERHQISPLCRDLAMRAMVNSADGGHSDKAILLLREVLEDDLTISVDALRGVVGACEQDHKWEEAVGVFFTYLSYMKGKVRNTWIVPGSELHIPQMEEGWTPTEVLSAPVVPPESTKLLSAVMRTCHACHKPGAALLCFQLFETSLPVSILSRIQSKTLWDGADRELFGCIEETLAPLIKNADSTGELLCATMVSLCGLKCYAESSNLFEIIKNHLVDPIDGLPDSYPQFPAAEQIYHYSRSRTFSDRSDWASAHRHIHRISRALHSIGDKREKLSSDQLWIISSALAAALRSCTLAEQPETGLLLSEQVRVELSRLGSLTGENADSLFRSREETVAKHELLHNDSLVAAKMDALHATNQGTIALSLFESSIDSHSVEEWPQSCNVAMTILAANNEIDEAIDLFRVLISSNPNVDSFLNVAQIFANSDRWNDVGDVYHMALEKGCLSERLGLLAMKAILEMNVAGRLRTLRGIINEAAQAGGTSSVDWMESHYWKVKDLLGFQHARLLMWWNDPETCHLDELQFALDVFEKRKAAGLKPKNTVLRLVVSHACKFKERDFPEDKKEIARVPRNHGEWARLLQRVIEEAEDTMDHDVSFIDDVAKALRRFNCDLECVQFVEHALARGVRAHQVTIREALRAADAAGISEKASGIRLMLVDDLA